MKHAKITPISLKANRDVDEVWVHDCISTDPSILGLGDVIVKDRERIQVGSGRLDLLLQDAEGYGRYEVEIQLGATDPSHIIRTIEYWDIERKRYPQYEHTAVIIAEDITSRFLNVIGLFNGSIPIIALQMTAVEMPDGIGLLFTRVLDTLSRGLVDEDEEVNEPVDRSYWESKTTPSILSLADQVSALCREIDPTVALNYNKRHIGMLVGGKSCNFVYFHIRKKALHVFIKVPQSTETDAALDQNGFAVWEYVNRIKGYKIPLSGGNLGEKATVLKDLLRAAYDQRMRD
jgi:hypothetical protein